LSSDCSEEGGLWGEAAVLVWVGAMGEEGLNEASVEEGEESWERGGESGLEGEFIFKGVGGVGVGAIVKEGGGEFVVLGFDGGEKGCFAVTEIDVGVGS